ncbi:MAG: winged helix-turn-helix domain-containing protein, partial [Acidimicrobiales bacterium]
PYRIRELVARMRAVARRTGAPQAPVASGRGPSTDAVAGVGGPDPESNRGQSAVIVGDVWIDPTRHEVGVRGHRIDLPLKEFSLLHYLMANAGRVLPRDMLIERVWGSDYVGDTKTLDVHIKRLRSRIEIDPSNPANIVTIRGLGYKYQRPEG